MRFPLSSRLIFSLIEMPLRDKQANSFALLPLRLWISGLAEFESIGGGRSEQD
jgi:hypothetical protein